jgi:hypothetical protein
LTAPLLRGSIAELSRTKFNSPDFKRESKGGWGRRNYHYKDQGRPNKKNLDITFRSIKSIRLPQGTDMIPLSR